MKPLRICAFMLVALGWCLLATAQQPVMLQIENGRVNLKAQNASIPQILAEWARVGGTRFINGERISVPTVTLELTNVPERQALDILLRSVAGYMLTARPEGSVGSSAFDRIFILATSNPPRTTLPPTNAAARPFVPPPGPTAVEIEQAPPEVVVDVTQDPNSPDGVRPTGPAGRVAFPVPMRTAPGNGPPPLIQPAASDSDSDTTPLPGTVVTTPTNPFGVPFGSSATPGVIAPMPPQPGAAVQPGAATPER